MKKRFLEYLLESNEVDEQEVDESAFKNDEFGKHDYQYLLGVLNDIVRKKEVGVGKKAVEKTVKIDKKIAAQLEKFLDAPNLLTVEDFNKILSGNKEPVKWTQIYKGKYSGQEGSSAGQYAEAAVAYVFNYLNGNTAITEADDAQYAEIANVLTDKNVSSDWIKSSQTSAEKLKKEVKNSKKYTAAHVDGNDISKIPENVKKIAAILHGKDGIRKVFGNAIDKDAVDFLYKGQKDTWNKADIVLVDTQFNIEDEIKDKYFAISDEFNMFFNDLINKGYIIPVSLKKISPKATLDQLKFEKEGKLDAIDKVAEEIENIKDVEIVLPKKPLAMSDDQKYAATCYLKTNTGLEVDFRAARGDKPRLSIELKLKTARGGKAMSELQRKLQLHNNFYSQTFRSQDDFIKQVENLTGINPEVVPAMAKSDKHWFNRPAFRGLVALLKIYHDKIEKGATKEVDLVGFFKLLYNCGSGANSDSIFWLLSMK